MVRSRSGGGLLSFTLVAISVLPLGRGLIASSFGAEAASQAMPEAWESAKLKSALDLLTRVPTGQELVSRAMKLWGIYSPAKTEEIGRHFQWGSASKTDAVLIRHYDPQTGEESRERQITVYLRMEQPLDDLVLDLAHELVHATSRPVWDPYDPTLTAGRYIQTAIEGEGGEVAAVRTECQVREEFSKRHLLSRPSANDRCKNYLGKNPADRIRRDFYRVGKWEKELLAKLVGEATTLPALSAERPALYSSTGGAPYPVALFEEYRQITSAACENSKKRAASFDIGKSGAGDRGPASDSYSEAQRATLNFISRRCEK